MINLGCGSRFHTAWTNADLAPTDPAVMACDLSKPFPFSDASFDVVYHSNVLEHIRHEHAHAFMRECFRILRPCGILRVAVPDLEQICRLYLENLQHACEHDEDAAARYDWMMLELLDQTVRERSGGSMLAHLRQVPLPAETFILERIGNEGRSIINWLRSQPPLATKLKEEPSPKIQLTLWQKLKNIATQKNEEEVNDQDSAELAIGRFRLGGEVHQWMYDRFSLARLMLAAGFSSPRLMTPQTSQIPHWTDYHLETGPDGVVHKPDSFIMESTKLG